MKMIVKSRLLIASAVLALSASMALAQTAPYDGTGDKTLSYGPRPQAATQGAPPAQAPVGQDQFSPNDPTSDKTFSYGARPAR
jgi:hypothetical protein